MHFYTFPLILLYLNIYYSVLDPSAGLAAPVTIPLLLLTTPIALTSPAVALVGLNSPKNAFLLFPYNIIILRVYSSSPGLSIKCPNHAGL